MNHLVFPMNDSFVSLLLVKSELSAIFVFDKGTPSIAMLLVLLVSYSAFMPLSLLVPTALLILSMCELISTSLYASRQSLSCERFLAFSSKANGDNLSLKVFIFLN